MTDLERDASPPTSASTLVAWVGLGAATGFFHWSLGSTGGVATEPAAALASYFSSLLGGLGVCAAAVGLGLLLGRADCLARASYASCILYAAFLTALVWNALSWLLPTVALAILPVLRRRDFSRAAPALLLAHSMGTLGALYATLHLPTFLAAWPAFRETLHSLWLVLTAMGS